jgi:hypothetical protein
MPGTPEMSRQAKERERSAPHPVNQEHVQLVFPLTFAPAASPASTFRAGDRLDLATMRAGAGFAPERIRYQWQTIRRLGPE